MRLIEKTLPGRPISYLDSENGSPALLFIPGWCSERESFEPVARRLGERHRVLLPDLRGHGRSQAAGDFGMEQLVADAVALIEASGAAEIVPVTESHAGWIAIELRRRLGRRIRQLVLIDWLVANPPAEFLDAVQTLQTREGWRDIRGGLLEMWFSEIDEPWADAEREKFTRYGEEPWRRAGREFGRSYALHGSPLAALVALEDPPPTVHIYGQPPDDEFLAVQERFSRQHPWFTVRRIRTRSHFPTLEAPDVVADAIESALTTSRRADSSAAAPTWPRRSRSVRRRRCSNVRRGAAQSFPLPAFPPRLP